MVHQDLGNWAAAKQTIEQSLALLTQDAAAPAILLAQAFNTQATLAFNQSQFQAAHDIWQQAQTYYTTAGDELGAWGARINQAQALKELGFYRRANAELLTINKALAATPDSDVKVIGLRTLGSALQAIGNVYIAYDAYAQSLAIAQKLGLKTLSSSLHTQIGKLALQLGNADIALEYFQVAGADAIHPLDTLNAYLGALTVYMARSQYPEANLVAEQVYEQLVTLPPSRAQIYGAINLAHQANQLPQRGRRLSAGQLDRLLASAAESANQFQDQRAAAHALREQGQVYEQQQQWEQAIELTQQSVNRAQTIRADDVLSQSAWQLARLHRSIGERDEAIAAYTEAVNALQALRGDLIAISQDLQFSFREGVEPVYRELVSLLLDGNPSQTELEQARNTIEGLQLAELDNFFQEACLDLDAKTIDQIDPKATVLYPIILSDKFAVIAAQGGQDLKYYTTGINQQQLDQQLRQLLASLHPSEGQPQFLANAQRLYDLLIRPAEDQHLLDQTETMVFVLDGLLRNIPMSVLHDGQHYLIEKYAIALSPGLQLLSAQSLDQQNFKALVGGLSEARGGFSALPEVEREVETISQTVSSAKLLNEEFTSQAVGEALKNSPVDVVHLATHGQFSSNLEDTFFLTWEDRINVRELSEILQDREQFRQQAVELLVLSACETATGDDRATLGLAGLAVKSGARSTIATLWPIKDQVAAELMIDFYHQLRTPGYTKAEALRQAQLHLLADENYREPFFWSPFILVGNWR
ncbi:MAG: CHAT domain-containing protein [Spirulina sp. SIO3F2]|nr:CHAT domain-containing protein [Spirulina sp. SIO3F2]